MKKIKELAVFLAVLPAIGLLKILPRSGVKLLSMTAGKLGFLYPSIRKLVLANLQTAFPEKSPEERKKIALASLQHVARNLLEFIWMAGSKSRFAKCCTVAEYSQQLVLKAAENGGRIIFVVPHLGSWEAQGRFVTETVNLPLSVIAKKIKNVYLDKLYNYWRRDTPNYQVIYSAGALRAAIGALKSGSNLALLIDQNVKARRGGVFMDFFGIPVPTTQGVEVLKDYCLKRNIPLTVVKSYAVRNADDLLEAHCSLPEKPLADYTPGELTRELLKHAEAAIRETPEEYVWLYHRFQYIDPSAPEEIRRRYPEYAVVPGPKFYK